MEGDAPTGTLTSPEFKIARKYISATRFVLPNKNGLSVKAEGGSVAIPSLTVYPIHSAWTNEIGD
jgi:hypothetical protein